MRLLVVILSVLAFGVAGCRSSDVPHAKPTSAAPPGVNGIGTESLGKAFNLDGMSVTLTLPTIGGDALGPWLSVHVRTVSPYKDPTIGPEFSILCSGTSSKAAWHESSTYPNGATIAASGTLEGDVQLLVPGDRRSDAPVPACATPIAILAESARGKSRVQITLDPSLAAMLDARRVKA
jgi:hypothetical protein